jgi:hypothetical protein
MPPRNVLRPLAGLGLVLGLALPASAEDQWGTVKGQVTWVGKELPQPEKVDVGRHAECCPKGEPILRETCVVNPKNRCVRWVFVWLAPADADKKLPVHPDLRAPKEKEVVMQVWGCRFTPHALAMRQGQVLVVKNADPGAHNCDYHGGPDNPRPGAVTPSDGTLRVDDLVASRMPVSINCNIHPRMKAWVRVYDHPYFAVTDADGKFEIRNAPAGKYNLVMWQEGVGWVNGGKAGQTITIPAGGTLEVKARLKPDAD